MYWIYLTIFTVIVFVPTFVRNSFFGLSQIQTQEYAILFLGSIAFALYVIQERKYKKQKKERLQMLKQVSRMAKDLTSSYSYIGEINRKLEILEEITLSFPKSREISARKQKELYDTIVSAISLFGKADEFVIRFIDQVECVTLQEIKSKRDVTINFSPKNCNREMQFFETEDLIIASTPRTINNITCLIIIKKKNPGHSIDDPAIMKTLAMQALSLFIFMYRKKKQKKNAWTCPAAYV